MASFEDPISRIERIIAGAEPEFQKAFLGLVSGLQNQASVQRVADLLARGNINEALGDLFLASGSLAIPWNGTFNAAGVSTSIVISEALQSFGLPQISVVWDQLNEGAVRVMRENRLRLVRGFTQTQVEATRTALIDGIQRGANPIEQARAFRGSIGLTPSQVRSVQNYRDSLERGSLEALNRQLRDKRFDSSVRRAASGGVPLTTEQIDRMVEAFRRRTLRHRSEVIARTEALRAANAGSQAMYLQAIENGTLDPNQLEQEWNTAGGSRVRRSHVAMDQQKRPIGVPFTSGNGASLRYPGDPNAPAEDSIECRCAIGTRILSLDAVGTTV